MWLLTSAWIEDFNIKPYHEYKDQFIKACKTRAFQDACQAIEKHITDPPVSCAINHFVGFLPITYGSMTCEFQKEEEPAPVSDDKSDDDVYKLKDDDEEKPESPKKMKKEIKRTPKVRFVLD